MTVTGRPSCSSLVAEPVPTTAGIPSSRAMIAVRPPRLVTIAGGSLHDRLPVGVGHIGDQHLTCIELMHVGNRLQYSYVAGADLLADSSSFHDTGPRSRIRHASGRLP